MLKIACGHCKETLLEADADWELAERTGMCPHCTHFYDPASEQQAELLASSSEIRAETRRLKLLNLTIGGSILGAGLLLFFGLGVAGGSLSVATLAVVAFGGFRVLSALRLSAVRQARSQIARPVDLRRMAQERSILA